MLSQKTGYFTRLTLPLLVTPEACFTNFPFGLTLEGQYIVKNLALITAGIVLGSTVRGGRIVTETA